MSYKDDCTVSIAFTSLDQSVQPIITIADDGRVTIADHLTVDDAAREFWNAVLRLNPMLSRPAPAAPANERSPRHIKVVAHAREIWSGDAKLAVAITDSIATEIAAAMNARAASANESGAEEALERVLSRTIDERDQMEEDGTRLAESVGKLLEVDVGEWSSANNPILAAIEALESRAPAQAAKPV
ncbi:MULTISPECIES: hypothetical protein [Burkholderia]|nr:MULTISPECIES: hypothetical protein [Burkholderia]ANW54837.1 hypothetical protein A7U59_00985 [Burkholderia pseudomallei]AOJ67528.1 hypothetical protein WS78_01200 [Burkholderia savannae]AOJ69248.1 hypothetical protein WS78_11120 [Burkholderia savannae]KVG49221.1 hypothetical protein WS77_26140 [Burkholderia sp. MSMB0265]KVG84019.1 hypothetical protein WS81_07065 [Burkholderia sp. MSMB2040]